MKKALMLLTIIGALSFGGCLNSDYSAGNVCNVTLKFINGDATLNGEYKFRGELVGLTNVKFVNGEGTTITKITGEQTATLNLAAWGNPGICDFKMVPATNAGEGEDGSDWAGAVSDIKDNISIPLPGLANADADGNCVVTIDLAQNDSYKFN